MEYKIEGSIRKSEDDWFYVEFSYLQNDGLNEELHEPRCFKTYEAAIDSFRQRALTCAKAAEVPHE